jgi:hypothetical protein
MADELAGKEPATSGKEIAGSVPARPAEEAVPAVTSSARPRDARRWQAVGVVALVLLLAGAAYVGAGWLTKPKAGSSGDQIRTTGKGGPGGQAVQNIQSSIKFAPELPQTSPAVMGLYQRRQDNSVFVGTGHPKVTISNGQAAGSFDGPVVEVVVTKDTKVWRDTTDMEGGGAPGPSGGEAQQTVAPGDLNDLMPNWLITAWGVRHGDRLVATDLLYLHD